MVEEHLISDLANVVHSYSREMWLFSTGEKRYLYHSQDAALKHACKWMYKKINDRLKQNIYQSPMSSYNKEEQDYFIVSDKNVTLLSKVKETVQNDYDILVNISRGILYPRSCFVEQLHYCTKDEN